MHCYDLEMLIREFADGKTKEDEIIRMELADIARLYGKCISDEVYSEAITRKFCSLIRTLNNKHRRELEEKQTECDYYAYMEDHFGHTDGIDKPDPSRYQHPDDLLLAFYNHFRNEKKMMRKDKKKDIDYPELEHILCLRTNEQPVNATMKDYVARIKTFANQYLRELLARDGLNMDCMGVDPILYTYENIEVILAKFNTQVGTWNEERKTDKQRVNIRSALRKLNEFKRAQEYR